MKALLSLLAVVVLVVIAYAGVEVGNQTFLFGVVIPCAAFTIFLLGFLLKVVGWARSPVPFRIPTTCGQNVSLPWIKPNKIDNPTTGFYTLIRMAFEVLTFRSLFRNSKMEMHEGPRIVYGSDKWLWLGALAFHYTFLIVLIRHLRFFTDPVPYPVHMLEYLDGFIQVTSPALLQSGFILVAAAAFLLARRFYLPTVRYISLPADFFPLFLIITIASTGILMRYVFKTNIVGVKELTMSLVALSPKVPQGLGVLFYIHVFLISVLFAYFPFSKLMHLGGVFLSPTRNLANNNRMVRHINPWNPPLHYRTYEEYEDEFREAMIGAGLPVEKKE